MSFFCNNLFSKWLSSKLRYVLCVYTYTLPQVFKRRKTNTTNCKLSNDKDKEELCLYSQVGAEPR